MRSGWLAAILVTGALAQCADADLVRRVPADRVTTTTADAAAAAAAVTRYRAAHGLGPVTVDPRLSGAAETQARAVAEAATLSHGRFSSRMDAVPGVGHAAENLAGGSNTVAEAMEQWKKSPGHNRNLLMAQARRIGFARADSPGHGLRRYWALVLTD